MQGDFKMNTNRGPNPAQDKYETAAIEDILDQLTIVHSQAVEDKLKKFEFLNNINEILDAKEIVDNLGDTIYCEKSGQIIKQFSLQEINQIIQACGKERATEALANALRPQVCPHWLYTDPIALDKLSTIDPIGYFVYAASRVLIGAAFSPEMSTITKNIIRIKEAQIKYQIRCQVEKLPIEKVIETNELMRQYLTITKSTNVIRFLGFEGFAIRESNVDPYAIASNLQTLKTFQRNLRRTLHNIIRYEQKKGNLKRHVTYDEIINLKLRYEGHANFAGQKKLKQLSQTEHYEMLLHNFFPADTSAFSVELQERENMAKLKKMEFDKKGVIPKKMATVNGKIVLKIKK